MFLKLLRLSLAIYKSTFCLLMMPPAVKTVISLLRNPLDKEMLQFKKSYPEFYAGYVSARVIVDRGGHKTVSPTSPAPATAIKQPDEAFQTSRSTSCCGNSFLAAWNCPLTPG